MRVLLAVLSGLSMLLGSILLFVVIASGGSSPDRGGWTCVAETNGTQDCSWRGDPPGFTTYDQQEAQHYLVTGAALLVTGGLLAVASVGVSRRPGGAGSAAPSQVPQYSGAPAQPSGYGPTPGSAPHP